MSATEANGAATATPAAAASAPVVDELAPAEWEILVRGVETATNDAALSGHPALREAFTSASDGFVPISVLSTLAPNAAVLRSHAEANLVEAARRSGVLVVNEAGTMFKRRHPFDRTAALGYPVIALSPIPKSATWSGIKGAVLSTLRRSRQTGTVRVIAQKCPACRIKAAARAAAKAAKAAQAAKAAAGDTSEDKDAASGDGNSSGAAVTAGDESKTAPAAEPAPCTCGQVAFLVVLSGSVKSGGDLVATLHGTKSAGEKLHFRRLSREEQVVFMEDHSKDLKSEPVAVPITVGGGRGANSTRGKRGAPGGGRDRHQPQSKRARGADDESVAVAGQVFPNRQALKSRVYYLLRSTGAGTPLSGDNLAFAKALLGFHERAAEKKRNMKTIVVDFHPKHNESLCLQVERLDGSREDFSWVKCVARVPLVSDKAVKINPGASINRRYAGHR